MGETTVRAWECDICKYVWIKVEGRLPTHCPNRDCRSRRWNQNTPVEPALAPVQSLKIAANPELDILRGIVAGTFPALEIPDVPDVGPPEIKFAPVVICGHREFAGDERRWYECRGPKHGRRTAHQMVAAEEVLE